MSDPRKVRRRPGRRSREELPPHELAEMFKERIYGSIACLATVVVLLQHDEGTVPLSALANIWIVLVGLWAATLLADLVGSLAAGSGVDRADLIRSARAAGQILSPGVVPSLVLIVAAVGSGQSERGLRIAVWVLVIQMGLFAYLAARRSKLPWYGQLLLVLVLLTLGVGVVLLKIASH